MKISVYVANEDENSEPRKLAWLIHVDAESDMGLVILNESRAFEWCKLEELQALPDWREIK